MAEADQAPEADPLPEEEPAAIQVPAGLAEPGQRLLARIVDTLVVGLPVVVVVRGLVPATDVDIVAPPVVAGFLLVYEWIQLSLWGRTLGKRFAGIHVEGTEPSPRQGGLGMARALLRTAVYALPIAVRPIPVFGLLAGLFWVANAALMYEGVQRRALHDRLARTFVVKRAGA